MKSLLAVSAALVMGGAVFSAAPASAAPMADRGVVDAIQQDHAQVEKARLVCNAWGRCWRVRPRFYGPRFYGGYGYRPRYYRRGWGHRRGFRRW